MEESWKGYAEEGVKQLVARCAGGMGSADLWWWMAYWEKPGVVAGVINAGAVAKDKEPDELDKVVEKYLKHVMLVAAQGDAERALALVLTGPENVHAARYYLLQGLRATSMIQTLARECASRWSVVKGFVGEK